MILYNNDFYSNKTYQTQSIYSKSTFLRLDFGCTVAEKKKSICFSLFFLLHLNFVKKENLVQLIAQQFLIILYMLGGGFGPNCLFATQWLKVGVTASHVMMWCHHISCAFKIFISNLAFTTHWKMFFYAVLDAIHNDVQSCQCGNCLQHKWEHLTEPTNAWNKTPNPDELRGHVGCKARAKQMARKEF